MFARELSRRRRARFEIDYAIHRNLSAFRRSQTAHRAFERLVLQVRSVSTLLRPCLEGGRPSWPGIVQVVQALADLSDVCRYWKLDPESWRPAGAAGLIEFGSLASHLFGGHQVPMVLVLAWLEEPSSLTAKHRMWFRHLAGGHRLRGLELPLEVTKAMVPFFMHAPSHLTVEQALRYSQWRARGCNRTEALDAVDPAWRRHLRASRPDVRWRGSGIRGFLHEENYGNPWDVRRWQIRELLEGKELEAEGRALHHCVAIYGPRCLRGHSSIWSLRRTDHRGADRPVATIEVAPRTRTIVQFRGKRNDKPTAAAKRIVLAWARKEQIEIDEECLA